jgi:signal transduction histidine kinase
MNSILLFSVDTAVAALVQRDAGSHYAVENEADSHAVVDRLRREPFRYDAIVIGNEVPDPVRLLQELAAIRKDLPSIILCEGSDVADLQRLMQFTPFLPSDLSIYLARPAEAAAEAIGRAALQMRRRRRYGSIVEAASPSTAIPLREEYNLAFLSSLLDGSPNAVVLFDQAGRTRQWNSKAEEVFGSRRALRHRTLADLLGDETAWALKDDPNSDALVRLETERGTMFANVRLSVVETGREVVGHVLTASAVDIKPADAGTQTQLEVANRQLVEQAADLRRMNDALQRSNRELEDFAYTASHDLQEPLRKINSFSDLLRSDFGETLGGDGAFYLDRLQDASNRMIELIRGLLEYSRVATNASPLQSTDLNVIIRRVLSDLEIAIEESGAQVDLQQLPTVEADPIQMRQLFQNLIGNAIKFRREGVAPRLMICSEADTEAGMASIVVADNGIGIEMRFAERIFAPFQRLHGRTRFEGSGMGLAICRRIVQRHHGSIELESQPGQGSTFRIHLPERQPETPA